MESPIGDCDRPHEWAVRRRESSVAARSVVVQERVRPVTSEMRPINAPLLARFIRTHEKSALRRADKKEDIPL